MPRRRPEALLANWRGAGLPFRHRPELLGELRGGRSNRSFLVAADGARWVLRLDAANAAALGVDRAREARILRAAAAAGLAPEVLVADPGRGYLVTRYVDGVQRGPATLDAATRERLLALIARLPALAVEGPVLDYHTHLARYTPDGVLPAALAARIATMEHESPAGLVHHDPTPGNVVFAGDQPLLIDWEYAAGGRVVMDLAVLVCDWGLAPAAVAERGGVAVALLHEACRLYREMCALWAASVAARGTT